MALGLLQKRIRLNRRRAARLRRVAVRRHFLAAVLGRRALVAKRKGHHVRARILMRRALRVKAMAARAGIRAIIIRVRIARLRRRRARRLAHHQG